MKKLVPLIITIMLSMILCCCSSDNTQVQKIENEDGSKSIIKVNEKEEIINQRDFDKNNKFIAEYDFEYFYDLNGRKSRMIKKNADTSEYEEVFYDKLKNIQKTIFYDKNNSILKIEEYLSSGKISVLHLYKNNKEYEYIRYQYFSTGDISDEIHYSEDGKTIKSTSFLTDGNISQIKKYNSKGAVNSIEKNRYKDGKLTKKYFFNGDFILTKQINYEEKYYEIITFQNDNIISDVKYDYKNNIINEEKQTS